MENALIDTTKKSKESPIEQLTIVQNNKIGIRESSMAPKLVEQNTTGHKKSSM